MTQIVSNTLAPKTSAPSSEWVSTSTFASLAGLDQRSAARICREVQAGRKQWAGAALVVDTIKGRGGRAGRRYRIRTDSLPDFVIDRLRVTETASRHGTEPGLANPKLGTRLKQRDRRAGEGRRRRDILAPILLTEPRGAARLAAVEAASKRHGVSVATLYRWLSAWQIRGLAGLVPSPRTRSVAPMIVSRAFDGRARLAGGQRGVSEGAQGRGRSLDQGDLGLAPAVCRYGGDGPTYRQANPYLLSYRQGSDRGR